MRLFGCVAAGCGGAGCLFVNLITNAVDAMGAASAKPADHTVDPFGSRSARDHFATPVRRIEMPDKGSTRSIRTKFGGQNDTKAP